MAEMLKKRGKNSQKRQKVKDIEKCAGKKTDCMTNMQTEERREGYREKQQNRRSAYPSGKE